MQKSYILGGTHGAALPTIDGTPTQLLVGGGVALQVAGEAFQVNSGATRVEQTAGFTVSDGSRFRRADDASRWLRMNGPASIEAVAANGAWATAFGGAFAELRASSSAIASTGGDAAALVDLIRPSGNGASDADVRLTAGAVNILRVSAGQLAGIPNIWFVGGIVPSASTPFIIDIVDTGAVDLTAPVVRNIDERFVLWNLAGATPLNLRGWHNSEYIEGSILAPNAALEFLSGTIEGQIAAKSLRVSGNGEIHHTGFTPELPTTTEVAGSWSSTGACDEPGNALTIAAVPGVVYTWTAGGPVGQTFSSFDGSGLVGTWAFTVAVTDASAYTLTGPASHSVTFDDPSTCAPPEPECIPASAVSYTYDPATNSGVITVADPEGSTGELCRGFWVTATSWKFIGAGVWPQSLDQVNHVEAGPGEYFISKPGSYPYAAAVECGQGDIYASYDAQPQPTPVLNGPSTPFEEHFLHDMGFTGPTPTYTVDSPGCNTVTPVAPTATAISECGVAGSLDIPTTPGVVYTLTIGDGAQGPWEVTAVPAANHVFAGAQQVVTFSGDLGTLTACAESVEPELEVATCSAGELRPAQLTIPEIEGLDYAVDGTPVAGGATIDVAAGSHLVTVVARDGWSNTGPESFLIEVPVVECVDTEVAYVAPEVVAAACAAEPGDEPLGRVTFELLEHLAYVFDGEPVTADALVFDRAPGTYSLVVTAAVGFTIAGHGDVAELTVVVPAATGCDEFTTIAVAPFADPATCDAFSVEGELIPGGITVTATPHVTFALTDADGDTTPIATPAPGPHRVAVPAGEYTVTATADPGWVITGPATWTLVVAAPEFPCLPTHALLPTAASWTDQVCTEGGVVDGTITVENVPGVTYLVDGVALPASSAAATTVKAAPGTHLIEAIADDPDDAVTTSEWTAVIAAASTALCGDLTTLPLTGGSAGGWLAVAGVLAGAGIPLVAAGTRRPRGRHRVASAGRGAS